MTYVTKVPTDSSRPLKNIESGNKELIILEKELIAVNKELLVVDKELNTKSQKQIEELQKLIEEVKKLDPIPPILPLYHNQFFTYGTTTEGTIQGPWNLEHYTTLTGYIYTSAYNLIIRVDYRDSNEQFIGLDEWVLGATGPAKGSFSSFHLPLLGPNVRMRFQGQTAGNATMTLQADMTKGLPKFAASLSPFALIEASLATNGYADFNVADIVGGPVNWVLNTTAGGNAAFVFYSIPPLPTFPETFFGQVTIQPASLLSYTAQGQIYLPPYPTKIRLYNEGSATQIVQCILMQ